MAWRKPEVRDLTAKLNQKEMQAFKTHPDFGSMADPVIDILEQAAEMVRGYCRTNKQIRMSPEVGSIPEGLISATMDYAVYDVLKRVNIQINDARKSAWEKALELFDKVAKGDYIPESWGDDGVTDDTQSNRAVPFFGKNKRRFILDEIL